MTIWKYPLSQAVRQTVSMPQNAKILTVQAQDGTPCIWAIIDPDAKHEDIEIAVYGTGDEMLRDASQEYIGSVHLFSGKLVFHVFKVSR